MESLWKSFSISFLLRSVFAGIFFVLSYKVAENSQILNNLSVLKESLITILTISLLAGVSIYGLHRALLYALLIEPILNSKCCENIRKCCPLITRKTIDYLLAVWDMDSISDTDKIQIRSKKMLPWGDYTHLHYTACWSIVAGALTYICLNGSHYEKYTIHPFLCWLSILFFMAGIVSDWRLKSLREYIIGEG